MVERVTAHDVPELVPEQRAHLFVIEQFERPRIDDDEGPLDTERTGIDEGRLRNEQLRPVRPVHRREDVGVELVELGKLCRADADGIGLEQQADAAFAEEANNLLYDFIESGDRAQGLQRGAVGGMLPRNRRDLREYTARTGRGQCGVSHLFRSPAMGFHNYVRRDHVFPLRSVVHQRLIQIPNQVLDILDSYR